MEAKKDIITLGGVEFTTEELNQYVEKGKKYIVHYRSIYEVRYSPDKPKGEFFAIKVAQVPDKGMLPYTKRGRFFMYDINQLTSADWI